MLRRRLLYINAAGKTLMDSALWPKRLFPSSEVYGSGPGICKNTSKW